MTLDPLLVGVVQGIAGIVSLGFLKPALDNRDTPGARSFGLFVIGTALWMFGLSGGNLTGDYALSVVAYNIVILGAEVAAAAWLLLALEVTDRTGAARRVVGVLVAGILGLQLLFWTNSIHGFMFGPETRLEGRVLVVAYGSGFWLHVGLSYLCGLLAEALLVWEAIRSTGIRRNQALFLALAAVPVIVANLLTLFTDLFAPYDVSPFGYLLTAVGLAVVLFRGRLLDITPVARRTAMAEINDAMVTLDEENRVIDANRRARELFGADEDDVGVAAAEFFSPVSTDVLAEFATGTVTDTEIAVELDGQRRHFSLSISAVGEGASQGRIVLLHDITTQKRRQQELQRQNERLDKFASVISHDLRNPLGIAETYLDFAEDTGDGDDFQAVREAHDRMDAMIEDLLTMARAETVVDDPQEIDLAALATEAWETTATDGATLETEIAAGTTIRGDPDLLQHVFENCFRNCVEHNDHSVTVTVGTLTDGFYIADDGVGIPPDERVAVFEHGHSTTEDGTGFGLSIVAELVEAHGWTVAVTESETGGARFEIAGLAVTGPTTA